MESNAPDRDTAIRILNTLRSAVPTPATVDVPYLHVEESNGRGLWLRSLDADFQAARSSSATLVRLVRGDYGDGKSHFLRMAAWLALRQGLAVGFVSIENKPGLLGQFDAQVLWRQFVQELATPQSQGRPEGLAGILDRWCDGMEDPGRALATLDRQYAIEVNFRQAVRGYVRAHFEQADKDAYLQWFQGDHVRPPNVRTSIDQRNAQVMLRSLAVLLRLLGHGGLVLILDELELIREQRQRVRDHAYESLRLLADNPYGVPGYVFLGAALREMFQPKKGGFDTYPALWQRLGLAFLPQAAGEPVNYRGTVIDLERTPLTAEELRGIAGRVRALFGIAEGWDAAAALPDGLLAQLVGHVTRTCGSASTPRHLIATLLDLLGKKRQDTCYDIAAHIPQAARDTALLIRRQEQQRRRQIGEEPGE
jgi:hypothetical protein